MQVNHIGALKEAFDRHGLDFNAVREEFVAVGPQLLIRRVPYSRALYTIMTECFMSCKLAESSVIS